MDLEALNALADHWEVGSRLRSVKRVMTMDAGEAMDLANAAYLRALARWRLLRLLVPVIGIGGFAFVWLSSSLRTAVILYVAACVFPAMLGYVWGRLGRR